MLQGAWAPGRLCVPQYCLLHRSPRLRTPGWRLKDTCVPCRAPLPAFRPSPPPTVCLPDRTSYCLSFCLGAPGSLSVLDNAPTPILWALLSNGDAKVKQRPSRAKMKSALLETCSLALMWFSKASRASHPMSHAPQEPWSGRAAGWTSIWVNLLPVGSDGVQRLGSVATVSLRLMTLCLGNQIN